jgi:hypothetical protein
VAVATLAMDDSHLMFSAWLASARALGGCTHYWQYQLRENQQHPALPTDVVLIAMLIASAYFIATLFRTAPSLFENFTSNFASVSSRRR